MIAENLRYFRGSRETFEAVDFDILFNGERYITTCAVNVNLLLCGVWVHPCGNGDDIKLDTEDRLKVLEFVQAERKKITDSYLTKTYKGWQESGLRTFEEYCFPGDKVDEAVIDHFVNSISPITLRSDFVQAGEAYSCEPDEQSGRHKNTYTTFHKIGDDLWIFDGYCFKGENENRVTRPSKLQQLIDEAREAIKREN